jgi:HEAT repeat protein
LPDSLQPVANSSRRCAWSAGVPALIEALKDKDNSMRAEAAGVLARMDLKGKAAVGALIAALEDKVGLVRSEAPSHSTGQ